jgi:hypothetical protein
MSATDHLVVPHGTTFFVPCPAGDADPAEPDGLFPGDARTMLGLDVRAGGLCSLAVPPRGRRNTPAAGGPAIGADRVDVL